MDWGHQGWAQRGSAEHAPPHPRGTRVPQGVVFWLAIVNNAFGLCGLAGVLGAQRELVMAFFAFSTVQLVRRGGRGGWGACEAPPCRRDGAVLLRPRFAPGPEPPTPPHPAPRRHALGPPAVLG